MTAENSKLEIEETAVARNAVLERGEKDTVANVRAELGQRGSNSTISAHIKQLRAGWGSPELFLRQFPQRMAELCREMGDMMEAQAIQRTAHLSALLEDERRTLAQQKITLNHERDLAIKDYEAEQITTKDLRQRLNDASQNLEIAVAELNELRPRLTKADLLNEQISERAEERSRKIEQLQLQITTYESEVKKQRQLDADHHAEQVNKLEQNLGNIRANELRLTQELGVAQRRIDKLTSDQKAADDRAEKAENERMESQKLVAELSVEQTNSQRREADREVQLRKAVTEKEEATRKLTKLQEQLIDAQANVENIRKSNAIENRSLITNLVEHSRRVFEIARQAVKDGDEEMHDLEIAQREIERLFQPAT